jgi:hypothetical protein
MSKFWICRIGFSASTSARKAVVTGLGNGIIFKFCLVDLDKRFVDAGVN